MLTYASQISYLLTCKLETRTGGDGRPKGVLGRPKYMSEDSHRQHDQETRKIREGQ